MVKSARPSPLFLFGFSRCGIDGWLVEFDCDEERFVVGDDIWG